MRAAFTRKLIRLMKNRGYKYKEIINLLRFIETMLEVEDENLNQLIYEEVIKVQEKEGDVMLLAKFEQKAMKKTREDIAKNMLKDNIDINLIAKYTGLTPEAIRSLIQKEDNE